MRDLLYLYFGINLRRIRGNRRLSQYRLGRRTKPQLRQELISRYERGLQPTERHARALADALGVTPETLTLRPRIIRTDGLQAVVIATPLRVHRRAALRRRGRRRARTPRLSRIVPAVIGVETSRDPEADR